MILKSYDVISYDIIIWYDIRKFAQNRHTDKQTENSKPEATLIPVDRRGERANYRANRSGLILQKKIRKFAQNRQTHKQTDKQTENSITEATLIPCGSSGGAGQQTENSITEATLIPCGTSGGAGQYIYIYLNKYIHIYKILCWITFTNIFSNSINIYIYIYIYIYMCMVC